MLQMGFHLQKHGKTWNSASNLGDMIEPAYNGIQKHEDDNMFGFHS
jgi:hypothetical protein